MTKRNCDLIPGSWIEEYSKLNPDFNLFLQQKARESRDEHTPADESIIELIQHHDRDDKYAETFSAERSKLLSVYSLLEEHDINEDSITDIACERLNTDEVLRVVPYREHMFDSDQSDDGTDTDLAPVYFVATENLFCNRLIESESTQSLRSVWSVLRDALQSRNYVIALQLLNKVTKPTDEEIKQYSTDLVFQAFRSDDIQIYEKIQEMIGQKKFEVNDDALQCIARNNSHHILKQLISSSPYKVRAYASALGSKQRPPIHTAANFGSAEVVDILAKYTDPETVMRLNHSNVSLLTDAASRGHNKTVEVLVTKPWIRELIEVKGFENYTALHYGAQELEYATFKKLYDIFEGSPSLLSLSSTDGYTAFHIMIHTKDQAKIMQFINDVGPYSPLLVLVDKRGHTPLHWAAHLGLDKVVGRLYDIYAKRDLLLAKTKEDGYTFMIHLIQGKHTSIIRSLIERTDFDPRLTAEVDNYGQVPMVWAIDSCPEICERFYEFNASSLLIKCKRGYNALMHAAAHDLSSVVELFTSDADLCNEQMVGDANGYTPLHYAIQNSIEACSIIYQQASIDKACVQTTLHQLTVLHMAVMYRCVDMVKVLLEDKVKAQALVGIRDVDGRTALDYACMRSPEMAEVIRTAMDI